LIIYKVASVLTTARRSLSDESGRGLPRVQLRIPHYSLAKRLGLRGSPLPAFGD